MKKYLALYILLTTIAFSACAQAGLMASPMQLKFNAAKGGAQQMNVLISNAGATNMQVAASIADWRRDSSGAIRYAVPGTLAHSCSSWLKILSGTQFTLGPHETKQVTISLQAPGTVADTMANSMLFFSQLNSTNAKQQNGMNLLLAVRIGIQVFYLPPGVPQKKGIEISNFTDSVFTSKDTVREKRLLLALNNTGNVETDGKVNFELHNLKTGEKTTLPEKKFYTLPGAVYVVESALPAGLAKGDYSATALVDYGQEYELKIGELQFKQQ